MLPNIHAFSASTNVIQMPKQQIIDRVNKQGRCDLIFDATTTLNDCGDESLLPRINGELPSKNTQKLFTLYNQFHYSSIIEFQSTSAKHLAAYHFYQHVSMFEDDRAIVAELVDCLIAKRG